MKIIFYLIAFAVTAAFLAVCFASGIDKMLHKEKREREIEDPTNFY